MSKDGFTTNYAREDAERERLDEQMRRDEEEARDYARYGYLGPDGRLPVEGGECMVFELTPEGVVKWTK